MLAELLESLMSSNEESLQMLARNRKFELNLHKTLEKELLNTLNWKKKSNLLPSPRSLQEKQTNYKLNTFLVSTETQAQYKDTNGDLFYNKRLFH